eukprot:438311_1
MSKRRLENEEILELSSPLLKKHKLCATTVNSDAKFVQNTNIINNKLLSYKTKVVWALSERGSVQGFDTKYVEFPNNENAKIESFYQFHKDKKNNNNDTNKLKLNYKNFEYELEMKDIQEIYCSNVDDSGLQRYEMIELNDDTDNKISNLWKNLIQLKNESNLGTLTEKHGVGLHICPLILFDMNGIIETEQNIINSLKQCELVCKSQFENNILSIIATFVCDDTKMSIQNFEKIISSTFQHDVGYNILDIDEWDERAFDKARDLIEDEIDYNVKNKNKGCEWNIVNDLWTLIFCVELENFEILSVEQMNKRFIYEDDDESDENNEDENDKTDIITDSTFKFIEYMLNNLNDCHFIEIYDADCQPTYYVTVGKSRTARPHLVGYFVELMMGW